MGGDRWPTVSEQLRIIELDMAKLDATPMDAEAKAAIRKQMQQLADDIAAGRRRLDDDS